MESATDNYRKWDHFCYLVIYSRVVRLLRSVNPIKQQTIRADVRNNKSCNASCEIQLHTCFIDSMEINFVSFQFCHRRAFASHHSEMRRTVKLIYFKIT